MSPKGKMLSNIFRIFFNHLIPFNWNSWSWATFVNLRRHVYRVIHNECNISKWQQFFLWRSKIQVLMIYQFIILTNFTRPIHFILWTCFVHFLARIQKIKKLEFINFTKWGKVGFWLKWLDNFTKWCGFLWFLTFLG